MKLREKPAIVLPDDIDNECIALCDMLNRIPGVATSESCCGHREMPYRIWFRCYDVSIIARLARCTDRNYSDGLWEVSAENADREPVGFFCLRSKLPLSGIELTNSSNDLIDNISYWFDDRFDSYFSIKKDAVEIEN